MKIVRLLLLAVMLVPLSSCSAFRAQVGAGMGIGAIVKVPALAHVGFGVGMYRRAGLYYGRVGLGDRGYGERWSAWAAEGLYHFETDDAEGVDGAFSRDARHNCFVFPWLGWGTDSPDHDVWSLEVGVAAIFVEVWLGFNPSRLF